MAIKFVSDVWAKKIALKKTKPTIKNFLNTRLFLFFKYTYTNRKIIANALKPRFLSDLNFSNLYLTNFIKAKRENLVHELRLN